MSLKYIIIGVCTIATPLAAHAQKSSSNAQLFNESTFQAPCSTSTPQTSGSSTSSCGPMTVGSVTGSASAWSTNVGSTEREVSATTRVQQTGNGGTPVNSVSSGNQISSISNAGIYTPQSTLVFHFAVPTLTDGFTGATSSNSSWHWTLLVQSTEDGNNAQANQHGTGDGATSTISLLQGDGHVTTGTQASTASGIDLWLPFGWYGSYTNDVFDFHYYVNSQSELKDGQSGAGANQSITAQLAGIDALDAQGHTYATGVYDSRAGTWALVSSSTTTTPEPGSLALLGTGLVGLVPVLRRKRNG